MAEQFLKMLAQLNCHLLLFGFLSALGNNLKRRGPLAPNRDNITYADTSFSLLSISILQ